MLQFVCSRCFEGSDCLTGTEFRSICLCLGLPDVLVVPALEFERLGHDSVEQHAVGLFSLLLLLWTLLGAVHHLLSTE